jgi:hypothetical protein
MGPSELRSHGVAAHTDPYFDDLRSRQYRCLNHSVRTILEGLNATGGAGRDQPGRRREAWAIRLYAEKNSAKGYMAIAGGCVVKLGSAGHTWTGRITFLRGKYGFDQRH